MNMIENHMGQIALSANAIAELPFPPPKIFTNALLQHHDITTLIRDTEAHERALFTVSPSDVRSFETKTRKSGFYNASGEPLDKDGTALAGLKPTSAVGRILGGDLAAQIRRGGKGASREKSEVDVEALLNGAEKLCGIYPIPGAFEKITSMRARHEQLSASIAKYEAKVAKQTLQLDRMNRPRDEGDDYEFDDEDGEETAGVYEEAERETFSAEDFKREEEEMRELEAKKRALEDRVSGVEKDIGGLMR